AAAVLLAGPINVFKGLGTWAHRVRSNAAMIDDASRLLPDAAAGGVPLEDVGNVHAALLLRRLALLKAVPREHSAILEATQKGRELLAG
ncbi:MAG: hypothetical protein ACYTGP_02540, partial [Planctomycetota bacterium]